MNKVFILVAQICQRQYTESVEDHIFKIEHDRSMVEVY